MRKLLAPATQVMNRLTFPKKFLLITGLFLAALVSPLYELITSVQSDVAFSTQEQHGIRYLNPVMAMLENLVSSRILLQDVSKTTAQIQSGLAKKSKARQTLLKQLQANEERFGKPLGSTVLWQDAQKALVSLTAHSGDVAYTQAITKTLALYGPVSFNSNLVLDPDADTYSLMDTLVLQLPPLLDLLEQAESLSQKAVAQGALLPEDQVSLVTLRTQIQAKFEMTQADWDVMTAHTKETRLKPALLPGWTRYHTALKAYMVTLDTVIRDPGSVSTQKLSAQARQAHQEAWQLYQQQADWFDRLLKARISALSPKIYRAIVLPFLCIVVIVFLLIGFYTSITEAIRQLVHTARRLAQGDLTARLKLDTQDEMTQLAVSLNAMADSFSGLIHQIRENSQTVAASSEELFSISSHMKSSAEQMITVAQTSSQVTGDVETNIQTVTESIGESTADLQEVHVSVNAVAAAIEEMTASLTEVSQNTIQASKVASRAEESAKTTRSIMETLKRAVSDIENVIELINALATQTNLLALNAAIEAVSAGEKGKGFMVVAEEVKSLAQQSSQATEEVRQKISEIQTASHSATQALEDIVHVIDGMCQINNTIASAVEEQTVTINQICQNISGSSGGSGRHHTHVLGHLKRLTHGSEKITHEASSMARQAGVMANNMTQVQQSAHANATSAGEVHATSQELAQLASHLEQLLTRFQS